MLPDTVVLKHKCTPLAQVDGDEKKVLYAGVFDGHGKKYSIHGDGDLSNAQLRPSHLTECIDTFARRYTRLKHVSQDTLGVCRWLLDGCAGGTATSEWLQQNLERWIDRYWQGRSSSAESDITDAFIKARLLLQAFWQ